MNKLVIFSLILGIIFVSSCAKPQPIAECRTDADCFKAGCSSQLCVPESEKGVITTCEYKEEYGCLQKTSCGCADGKCAWEQNRQYLDCMEGFGK